jgi:hypothetical protein
MLMGLRVWNSPDDLAVQVYQAAENTISEGVGGFVGASHLTPKISILWPIAGHSTSAENAKIYAGISQTGEFSMARQTDWEHMTDKQKFDFLYSWCHKLEATLDGRREVIYRTNAELQKVQKKLKGEIWEGILYGLWAWALRPGPGNRSDVDCAGRAGGWRAYRSGCSWKRAANGGRSQQKVVRRLWALIEKVE